MIEYTYARPRTSLSITLSVWNALFLREAVTRLSAGRIAWLWLLVEPIIQICIMIFIFTVVRMRVVSGISTEAWLVIGLVTYTMFKRTSAQVQNALSSNRALFIYRQVKPVDAMLARAWLEGFISILVAVIIFSVGSIFFGFDLIPHLPLEISMVFFGMWLMGLGFGLITSVTVELIPKMNVVLGVVTSVLHITSGVIFPVHNIPKPYRDILMFNPLLHATEAARASTSPLYHAITGVDIGYLYRCAVVAIFFGLILHKRFEARLVAL